MCERTRDKHQSFSWNISYFTAVQKFLWERCRKIRFLIHEIKWTTGLRSDGADIQFIILNYSFKIILKIEEKMVLDRYLKVFCCQTLSYFLKTLNCFSGHKKVSKRSQKLHWSLDIEKNLVAFCLTAAFKSFSLHVSASFSHVLQEKILFSLVLLHIGILPPTQRQETILKMRWTNDWDKSLELWVNEFILKWSTTTTTNEFRLSRSVLRLWVGWSCSSSPSLIRLIHVAAAELLLLRLQWLLKVQHLENLLISNSGHDNGQ